MEKALEKVESQTRSGILRNLGRVSSNANVMVFSMHQVQVQLWLSIPVQARHLRCHLLPFSRLTSPSRLSRGDNCCRIYIIIIEKLRAVKRLRGNFLHELIIVELCRLYYSEDGDSDCYSVRSTVLTCTGRHPWNYSACHRKTWAGLPAGTCKTHGARAGLTVFATGIML